MAEELEVLEHLEVAEELLVPGARCVHQADLPAYSEWAAYANTHRRNAQQRYLELELEELGG